LGFAQAAARLKKRCSCIIRKIYQTDPITFPKCERKCLTGLFGMAVNSRRRGRYDRRFPRGAVVDRVKKFDDFAEQGVPLFMLRCER
jgi:hypothetical protein